MTGRWKGHGGDWMYILLGAMCSWIGREITLTGIVRHHGYAYDAAPGAGWVIHYLGILLAVYGCLGLLMAPRRSPDNDAGRDGSEEP